MDALLNYAVWNSVHNVSTLTFDDEQNNDPSTAEMRWDRRLWGWRGREDKGHHLRQQWRSSMSSDQHFSPPRFCFTLLITGSPLTTDKNYSSKTCGRCARRALYNVRYNPRPPPRTDRARSQSNYTSFTASIVLATHPQPLTTLLFSRVQKSACRAVCASSVFYTRGAAPAPSVSVKRLKNVCFSDDPESEVIVWIEWQKGMRSGIHL